MVTSTRVPLVGYLRLGDEPHLTANECAACHARFFDRRNACASCGTTRFGPVDLPTRGFVRAYTIVMQAAPGIEVPFIAAIVECDGTSIRANVVNVPADPEHIRVGMPVRLVTFPVGTDSAGTEAVGFGFEPIQGAIHEPE
jgi:uncharacterized OB-fold protein